MSGFGSRKSDESRYQGKTRLDTVYPERAGVDTFVYTPRFVVDTDLDTKQPLMSIVYQ